MSPPCLVSVSPTFQHRGAWTAQVPLSTAQDKFRSSLTFLTSKIRILLRDVRFVSRSEVLADSLVAHPLLFSLHVCSRRVPKAVEWSPPVPDCSQLFDGGMVNSPPPPPGFSETAHMEPCLAYRTAVAGSHSSRNRYEIPSPPTGGKRKGEEANAGELLARDQHRPQCGIMAALRVEQRVN